MSEENLDKYGFLVRKLVPKLGLQHTKNREAWIKKQLKKIPKGYKILDIGAGELIYKKYCEHLEYTSMDFGQYDGQINEEGLHKKDWKYGMLDVIGDASKLSFKNEKFDVVLLTEVLEHVPEPFIVLKEASRVLKKNGILILTAPFTSETHFAPFHFATGFSRFFYEEHLPKFDFEIVEIEKNGTFFSCLSTELMRTKLISPQYVGRKLNFIEEFFIFMVLKILENLSKNDKKSSELWCATYHVLAKKINTKNH